MCATDYVCGLYPTIKYVKAKTFKVDYIDTTVITLGVFKTTSRGILHIFFLPLNAPQQWHMCQCR